jgi:hypothetical protein
MKKVLKGAWVLITGTSNGWPVERTVQQTNGAIQLFSLMKKSPEKTMM